MIRWIIGTVIWVVIACVVVALIWSPDPVTMGVTALASIAVSVLVGNTLSD